MDARQMLAMAVGVLCLRTTSTVLPSAAQIGFPYENPGVDNSFSGGWPPRDNTHRERSQVSKPGSVPLRVETTATWRPSGEQAGSYQLRKASKVSARDPQAGGAATASRLPSVTKRSPPVAATRLCLHQVRNFSSSSMIRVTVTVLPVVADTAISGRPSAAIEAERSKSGQNKTHLPSGDH